MTADNNNIQLTKAWQELIKECRKRPKIIGIYPPEIDRHQELLFVQVFLDKIQKNDRPEFYWDLYKTMMKHYYQNENHT